MFNNYYNFFYFSFVKRSLWILYKNMSRWSACRRFGAINCHIEWNRKKTYAYFGEQI
jgi:hypothetical protein